MAENEQLRRTLNIERENNANLEYDKSRLTELKKL